MVENMIKIETKDNTYTFDYLTCFEKPMGLLLGAYEKRYEHLFYLYLKLFQSYNTKTFGRQDLYIFDFTSMIRWIIENPLNLKLDLVKPGKEDFHSIIEKQIDRGSPVILTVNLKELFYSRYYQKNNWPSILLINGYDHENGLYSVMDTTITEFDEHVREGQDYRPFVLPYTLVERLYDSYEEEYKGMGFAGYVDGKNKVPPGIKPYIDCISLFLEDDDDQPYKEIDFINEITLFLEKGVPVKSHGVDEVTSEIDFVLIRVLNYKEVFFKELQATFSMFKVNQELLAELEERYRALLKLWSKIKNKSVICYRINAALEVTKQLEEVITKEREIRDIVKRIKGIIEESREELDRVLDGGGYSLQIGPAGNENNRVSGGEETKNDYVEPGDELQKKLADIWGNILGKDKVGIRDNFFDLGGHSLSMVRFIAIIIKEFNVEIPLELFFKSPYIKDFSQYILEHSNSGGYEPIPPAPRKSQYPLSAAQRRLFIIDQLHPGSITYNVTIVMEMDAVLDISKIRRAFNQLVERHEALRTCFTMMNGVPYQEVKESLSIEVEYHEALPGDIDHLIEGFVKPFDLTKLPLIRLMYVKVGQKSLLVFDVPHIIIDGVSVGIMIKEFTKLYTDNHDLPTLKVQYKDYAAWQNQVLNSAGVHQQENYWVECFQGDIPILSLPLDHPRPTIQSFKGDTIHFTIDDSLTSKIYRISKEKESTLYMVLFAVFNVLLHKYSGQEDIIVGSPVADRPHVDLHNMLGMFVNMMPIRNFPQPDKPFFGFLEEIKNNALGVYRNQDCQFEVLVEKLGLKGSLDSNPLFNVVFALQNIDLNKIEMDGVSITPYQFKNKISKFDMLFEVLENETGIDINIEYCATLFKKATIERFGQHFVNLLQSIVKNPNGLISDLEVMSRDEADYLVYQLNKTDAQFTENVLIHQLFEQQAQLNPGNCAVEFNDVSVTYQELNEQSNTIAAALRSKGIKNAQFTGVVIDRSIEMIEAVMAILKAGGAYIPLEPYLPDERIKKILEDLSIKVLITCVSQMERLKTIVDKLPELETIICLDTHLGKRGEQAYTIEGKEVLLITGVDPEKSKNLEPAAVPEDIAYIIFTSGSTGTPKGVVVKHKPAINLIEWVNKSFGINSSDKILFITSLSFDLSVYDIFGILGAGAVIRLKSHEDIREPESLMEAIIKEKITFWDSAPPALQQLAPYFKKLKDKESSRLRLVFLSGDWIPVSLPDQLKETFKGVQVIALGGATEATVWSNYYPIGTVEPDWPSIPYGKPILNARYYILDKKLKPVPIGVSGDLYIGGKCLASGYINAPEITGSKFLPSPFVAGELIYRTGDLSRWLDNGNIEFLGRADHQVKVRGYRIELGEIESNILKNKDIKEAIVIAEGEKTGEKQLFAFFVADRKYTVVELKAALRQELPDYMIPSLFVQVEAMPLTANGKLDRKKLLDLASDSIETGMEYVSAETDMEVAILNIWKGVLNRDKISLYDNFFDLGGNSFSLIAVKDKINKLYNKDIPTLKMFQYPTIQSFEQYLISLDKEEGDQASSREEQAEIMEESLSIFNKTLELIRE